MNPILPKIGIENPTDHVLSPYTWSKIQLPMIKKSVKIVEKTLKFSRKMNKTHNKSLLSKEGKKRKSSSKQDKKRKSSLIDLESRQKDKSNSKNKDDISKNYRSVDLSSQNRGKTINVEKNIIIEKHLKSLTPSYDEKSKITTMKTPSIAQLREKTFCYTKIQPYFYKGLVEAGWKGFRGTAFSQEAKFIFTQKFYEGKLRKGQLNNHMKNGHLLSLKYFLHECQSAFGLQYYPSSFLLQQQYDQFCLGYQENLIKISLKMIAVSLNSKTLIKNSPEPVTCLGKVLPRLTQAANLNPHTLIALKLCLYLENYRKNSHIKFFELSSSFTPVDIRLQQSVRQSVVKLAFQMVELNNAARSWQGCMDVTEIDEQLQQVIWLYHCMLCKYDHGYSYSGVGNLWIVKPIASSKGAGIFLLPNSLQFTTINPRPLSTKHKLQNKIVQKYIEQPLLLLQPTKFKSRKFDIRQWVILSHQNEPVIYKYSEGYCRFSDLEYKLDYRKKDEQRVHLTNCTANEKGGVLMLEEVLGEEGRNRYEEQVRKIIVESVMNTREVVFEEGRFQFLGFDLLMDENYNLWLLEINTNPACNAARYDKLETEANKMISQMADVLTSHSTQNCWQRIYGEIRNSNPLPSKSSLYPHGSLIEQISNRNYFSTVLNKLIASNLRAAMVKIKAFC